MNEFKDNDNLEKNTNEGIENSTPVDNIDTNDVSKDIADITTDDNNVSKDATENRENDVNGNAEHIETESSTSTTDSINEDTEQTTNTTNIDDLKSHHKNKAKKYSYRRSIAVGLTGVVLCGASLGFFLGVGLNTSNKIVNGVASVANGTFSFNDDSVKSEETNAIPVNLVADEKSIASTIASVENQVVNISIKAQTVNFFNQVSESEGAGSGIIYKIDGDKVYIVTNNHVVDGASQVTISVTGTEQISAKLVGKDSSADIAVISVSKAEMEKAGIKDITAAKFSNADNAEVGESVIAIGNALGRGKTATLGILSAQNKEINIDGKNFTVIQTDAAINPGNSGGALINTSGEVIGINTAKLSDSSVEGTGYAIPSKTAISIADQLITNGNVKKAYLGISGATITDDFKKMYGIDVSGVFVSGVEENSSAANAGIQQSDIITAVDGKATATIEDLSKIISSHKPNDKIKISIVRNGNTPMEVTATLADANSNF